MTNAPEKDRAEEIRRHAHRLAAEGLEAALNQWELDRHYKGEADQDALASELQAIANRLRKQGGGQGSSGSS